MREAIFMGNTVRIPLTQEKEAVVDLDVFLSNALFGFPWTAEKTKCSFYAYRRLYFGDGSARGVKIYMHRLVAKAHQGIEVDHRDGDGLNNRRENLRFCSHAQNTRSKLKKANHTFLGVHWKKDRDKWRATITRNHAQIHLGYFESEIDAAMAYNDAAAKLFGEFARLNPI